jgi:hypothetical protein
MSIQYPPFPSTCCMMDVAVDVDVKFRQFSAGDGVGVQVRSMLYMNGG